MNWWKKLVDYVRSLFYHEYEVTVWFSNEDIYDGKGVLLVSKKIEKVFHMTEITKLTAKHIVGKEKGGKRIEIRTQKPFDYNVRKIQ